MHTNEYFLSEHLSDRLDRQTILHGSAAGISFVDRRSFELPIRKEHLAALGLAEGSVIYSVLLVRDDEEQKQSSDAQFPRRELPPFATLLASPVPPPSWERGLRICFSTTKIGKGQLRRLTTVLRKTGLYVRHVHAVGGLDLENYFLATAKGESHPLEPDPLESDLLETQPDSRMPSQPSIIFTVEYPLDKREPEMAGGNLARRYVEMWQSTDTDYKKKLEAQGELLEHLVKMLKGKLDSVRIEWISPLQTLNGLSGLLPKGSRTREPETVKLRVKRSSFDRSVFCLSLDTWRRQLDPAARTSIEDNVTPGLVNLGAAITVDTEERTLTAAFVPLERYAVAQFEVLHPAGRLQHLWKEWIYEEIEDHGGTVLQAFSHGRLEERWARELVMCYFDFAKPTGRAVEGQSFAPDYKRIGRISRCMLALQGMTRSGGRLPEELGPSGDGRPNSRALKKLRKRLLDHRLPIAIQTMPGLTVDSSGKVVKAPVSLRRRPRWDSTLRDVKLWYRWPDRTDMKYQKKFKKSKFNFTKPLTLDLYKDLYSANDARASRSRMRLVDRLVERLIDEKNPDRSILVLGSHRSGKTSVLNMVREKINRQEERSEFASNLKAIGVVIDATVTPPHLLILALIRELREIAERGKHPAAVQARSMVNNFLERVKEVLGTDVETISMMGLSFGFSLGFAKGGTTNKNQDKQDQAEVVDRVTRRELAATWESDEGRAAFLRDSIQLLRKTLAEFEDDPFPIVIAIDEVSATTAWGNHFAFPVWRSLIESDEFRQLRWLLSSTVPLTEATGYSPLGNAVREFSMRPLSEYEAEKLLENFDTNSVDAIPVVLTYEAKQNLQWLSGRFPYFLQVVCAHVLERTVAYHIPVITQSLVRHIVRTKVIAELADYFVGQEQNLPEAIRIKLVETLAGAPDPLKEDSFHNTGLTAIERRGLQKLGLGWAEGPCVVAPLFAYWLWLGVNTVPTEEGALEDSGGYD